MVYVLPSEVPPDIPGVHNMVLCTSIGAECPDFLVHKESVTVK